MANYILIHGAWHTGDLLEDTAMPQSFPWHPRLSEKLGLFRLVQTTGSHELCFTNPSLLGQKILDAGKD